MGSSGHDNFVLRWNDFQSNVTGSLVDLRVEEDFFDVTLACDEEHQMQVTPRKKELSCQSNDSCLHRREAQMT